MRDVVLMRYQNDRVAALVQPREQGHDLDAGRGIQRAGRFVRQQNRRMIHQRARHRHALPLAARKLAGLVIHALRQIHFAQAPLWPAPCRSFEEMPE